MQLPVQAQSALHLASNALYAPTLQPQALPNPPELEETPAGKLDGRLELPLDELSFHRLSTPAEIAQILHLRGEIQLPASALADPSFQTREKKETSTG